MNMFEHVDTRVGGWAWQLERHDRLAMSQASPIEYIKDWDAILASEGTNKEAWMPIEDQGNQGSCRGHSLSTAIEDCIVASGGPHVQLSRACGYYETQRIDGIRGDNGSTIEGGCRLAEEVGICLEKDWPYPQRYSPQRPAGYDRVKKYGTAGHLVMRSAKECLLHVANVGPLDFGILWTNSLDSQAARDGIVRSYSPRPSVGGHALAAPCYRLGDWQGKPLPEPGIVIFNSWSPRWGNKGRVIALLSAVDAMIQERSNIVVGHIPKRTYDL